MKAKSYNYPQILQESRNGEINQTYNESLGYSSSKSTITQQDFRFCDIIGNFMKGFIIIVVNGNLFLIDQHAVSQKSLYQQSMYIFSKKINTKCEQYIKVPNLYEQIFINRRNQIQIEGWQYQILNKNAYDTSLVINQAPQLYGIIFNDEDFLFRVQKLYYSTNQQHSEHVKYILATRACHNAYRIGDILHDKEMRGLTDTMYKMNASFNCPHTRPTVIAIGEFQSFQTSIQYNYEYSL